MISPSVGKVPMEFNCASIQLRDPFGAGLGTRGCSFIMRRVCAFVAILVLVFICQWWGGFYLRMCGGQSESETKCDYGVEAVESSAHRANSDTVIFLARWELFRWLYRTTGPRNKTLLQRVFMIPASSGWSAMVCLTPSTLSNSNNKVPWSSLASAAGLPVSSNLDTWSGSCGFLLLIVQIQMRLSFCPLGT